MSQNYYSVVGTMSASLKQGSGDPPDDPTDEGNFKLYRSVEIVGLIAVLVLSKCYTRQQDMFTTVFMLAEHYNILFDRLPESQITPAIASDIVTELERA